MTRRFQPDRRILLVLFLLCLMVSAQFSALSAQSQPHQPTDHCCLLCHVGPMVFLQTSVSGLAAPVFQVVWLAPLPQVEATPDVLLVPRSSRAPPVL
jgi:hypothetical protein